MSIPAPKRDPKSGRWRFRKAVPLDLRELVGKLEIVRWLGGDAKVARERNAELHVEWDQRFAGLRAGPAEMGRDDAEHLARQWRRWFVAEAQDDLTRPQGWLHTLDVLEDARRWQDDPGPPEPDDDLDLVRPEKNSEPDEAPAYAKRRVEAFLMAYGRVSDFLVQSGQVLEGRSLTAFLGALLPEFYAAHRALAKQANAAETVAPKPAAKAGEGRKSVEAPSITGLAEDYFTARKVMGLSNEAELRWRPVVRALVAFLGHERAADVTPRDLVRWKDELLKTHAPKTVRDSDMAAIKTIYGWGVENLLVADNPAKGVKVRVPKKQRDRGPGFTDVEAKAILAAAVAYVPGEQESAYTTAAKRWGCWLCAFTGARISELMQLRKQDVRKEDGIVVLHITPEAGSVKTGQYRFVPLHPQLIEMGFLALVEAAPEGPLFFPATRKGGQRHPSKAVAALVASWVQDLGVIGPGVAPNHGWRHRFKTVTRDVGIDLEIRNALQGHGSGTAAEAYGEVSLAARSAAVALLPRYAVGASAAS